MKPCVRAAVAVCSDRRSRVGNATGHSQAMQGVRKHLLRKSVPHGLTYVGELLNGHEFSPKMVCHGVMLGAFVFVALTQDVAS
jgi:hypothetical protein